MFLFATFELMESLEFALYELQKLGLTETDLFAVPLDKRAEESRLFDSLHRSDGISTFDGTAMCSAIFMVLGTIYGYILNWGPILWALIGIFGGGVLGFLIDFFITRPKRERNRHGAISTEVVLLVKCPQELEDKVRQTLWKHHALGLAKVDRPS
ncbi:hypothetical protein JJB07_11555 [Tumebacillus sp. ITR2]|uniref:Uncharacterized protein n=1 Tax=Tumebacillus amylolyticus TaxID=2801339 RepID=A0ABS1JAI6_9BACL|nr:hypothetical protein [Tumebacillus amylolyticus]MBL0387287.1 hypothetical protein [Tumebacillus amylolyticus]